MDRMVPPKTPPRRSIIITARVVTALVSLAGAEGMLWFLGYPQWWRMDPSWGGASPEYQCDSELGWRAREGTFDLGWAGQRPAHYTNWSGGRRATADVEPASDAKNRPQVFFVGDSFPQGYQLSDSETLPWMVQQRHPEARVWNFGAGNYGTYQSYLVMKKWVHGPSSVYYLFNAFHEGRNAADPNWLRIFKKPPPGCFYPFAEFSGGELQARQSHGDIVWPLSRKLRTVAMVQEYKQILESYVRVHNRRRLTETLLVKMNETVRAEGGKFTVILFDMSPEERTDYRQFLQSQRINIVDCERPEMSDRSLRLADGHPGKGLNELLAGWIEPLILVEPSGRLVSTESSLDVRRSWPRRKPSVELSHQ
jgi:hypothetical protein